MRIYQGVVPALAESEQSVRRQGATHTRWVVVALVLFLLSTQPVWAQLGAGVGIGSIYVEETLTPGGIYKLPDLPVINTGSLPANYQVSLSSKANQPQFKPDPNWFLFKPQIFHLEPGQSQNVRVTLRLPLTAPAGDYFAYLQASTQSQANQVALGPAAAAKLSFTVDQAPTVLGAVRQRIFTLWHYYQPWTFIILLLLDILLILALAGSLVSFRISLTPRQDNKNPPQTHS